LAEKKFNRDQKKIDDEQNCHPVDSQLFSKRGYHKRREERKKSQIPGQKITEATFVKKQAKEPRRSFQRRENHTEGKDAREKGTRQQVHCF